MRSWLLKAVAAFSVLVFAVLAIPAQAGGNKKHHHHGWRNSGHAYHRGWSNRAYGYSRPYRYYPAPSDRPVYYNPAPVFVFGFGFN